MSIAYASAHALVIAVRVSACSNTERIRADSARTPHCSSCTYLRTEYLSYLKVRTHCMSMRKRVSMNAHTCTTQYAVAAAKIWAIPQKGTAREVQPYSGILGRRTSR
jgi:hypothetical protein